MAEPNWGLIIADILKYTIPALIVFLTIYFLGKQFFANQTNQKVLDDRVEHRDKTMAIKLQAYERLILFCDRIDVVNLALRLSAKDLTADDMMRSMLISIQKEYEHNLVQQIYVSDKLWQIISQAKTGTISLITAAHNSLGKEATAGDLLTAITKKINEVQMNPSETAKGALRSEASHLLNI